MLTRDEKGGCHTVVSLAHANQLAATSEIVKTLLVLSRFHVRSAIATTGTGLYLYLFGGGATIRKYGIREGMFLSIGLGVGYHYGVDCLYGATSCNELVHDTRLLSLRQR